MTTTIEVWVLVDENGDHVASHDVDLLDELYADTIGDGESLGMRYVKCTLTVPLPTTIELTGEVKDEPNTATMTVK